MKGCLKFFIGLILFLMLAVVGGFIGGLLWIDKNCFVSTPLVISVPKLDLYQQAQLTSQLLPLKNLIEGKSKKKRVKIKLSAEQTNWLVNRLLERERLDAQVKLTFDSGRARVRFTKKITDKKFLNILLSSSFTIENGDVQLGIDQLQIGDFIFPPTLLGQISYLLERYIDQQLSSKNPSVKIETLELKKDKIIIEAQKSKSHLSKNQ